MNGRGWHLDRARFDAFLRAAAEEAGAVREEGRATGAEREGGGWRLTLASGETLAARAWIDAGGRPAALARRQGAVRRRDDDLIAFHARFRPGRPGDLDSRTLVEAGPDGWWYTARIPSGERAVAFFTDRDLADRKALLSARGFAAAVGRTRHVAAALAAFASTLDGRPRGAGAGSTRLEPAVGPGWAAAGDAALAFDPLSSQGLFNALYTGWRAGLALAAYLAGDERALPAYAARLEEIGRAYRRNRAAYYGDERRFADRPFWRRRQGPA